MLAQDWTLHHGWPVASVAACKARPITEPMLAVHSLLGHKKLIA